jgi:hypothetical protein
MNWKRMNPSSPPKACLVKIGGGRDLRDRQTLSKKGKGSKSKPLPNKMQHLAPADVKKEVAVII